MRQQSVSDYPGQTGRKADTAGNSFLDDNLAVDILYNPCFFCLSSIPLFSARAHMHQGRLEHSGLGIRVLWSVTQLPWDQNPDVLTLIFPFFVSAFLF